MMLAKYTIDRTFSKLYELKLENLSRDNGKRKERIVGEIIWKIIEFHTLKLGGCKNAPQISLVRSL